MALIYHITTPQAWAEAQATGQVVAESLEREGFIHCSRQSQLLVVADRFFPGVDGLLVLAIDKAEVEPNLKYEGPVGEGDPFSDEVFPHVYAPVPVAAVVGSAPLMQDAGDKLVWPAGLPQA